MNHWLKKVGKTWKGAITKAYQIINLCQELLHIKRSIRAIIIIIQQLAYKVSKSANVTSIYLNLLLACFIIGQRWCNHDEKSNEAKH